MIVGEDRRASDQARNAADEHEADRESSARTAAKTTRNNAIALAITIWGLGLLLLSILWFNEQEMAELRASGLRTEATVRDKMRFRNPGQDTTSHVFDITYMHRASAAPRPTAHIDVMAGEFELPSLDIGSFQPVRIDVPARSFRRYEIGDAVEVVYIPGDPRSAQLADHVDGWSRTPGRVMLALFVLGGMASFGYGLKVWWAAKR